MLRILYRLDQWKRPGKKESLVSKLSQVNDFYPINRMTLAEMEGKIVWPVYKFVRFLTE